MTSELNRLAMWSLVDELVTRIYRLANSVAHPLDAALLKEAALTLAQPAPIDAVQEKLLIISELLEMLSHLQPSLTKELQLVDTAIADTSAALRRLDTTPVTESARAPRQ